MMADAGGIPLGQLSGSDATNALRESIERFNAKTARQTTWLLRLTWAIAALTLVMAIGVGVQIFTAMSVRAEGDGRVAQPFGFRPHGSERAAFPHSAPPEGYPTRAKGTSRG